MFSGSNPPWDWTPDASIGFGFRKLRFKDVENPLPEFGNVGSGRIPEDLPIQIEIGVHDPVPHGNDLSPRQFGVAFPQLNRQAVDRLADYRQVMKNCRGQDLVFEESVFRGCRNDNLDLAAGGENVLQERRLMPHR